jgi:hypothetical protein
LAESGTVKKSGRHVDSGSRHSTSGVGNIHNPEKSSWRVLQAVRAESIEAWAACNTIIHKVIEKSHTSFDKLRTNGIFEAQLLFLG